MTPQDRSRDVVQGTLDMLVLKALSLTPMHGWGITNRIGQITKGVLTVNPGSLYPALERLASHRVLQRSSRLRSNVSRPRG